MTGPETAPPPAFPYPSPRLERPRDSAVKGVCAALARTTGTDVVLWRVLIVVLVFFGGLGILLYLAGIVAIPAEGERYSLAQRVLNGPDRRLTPSQVLLLVLLALAFAAVVSRSSGLVVVVVLGTLGLLWWRRRRDDLADPTGYGGDVAVPDPPADPPPAAPHPHPHPAPKQPRPQSPLGGLTASLAVLAGGVLLLLGATDVVSVSAEVVLAIPLALVGLGLVLGAWWGRSGGLVLAAAALGLALAATIAVRPALDAGIGDRTWTPLGSADYRLGVGDATLDLRDVRVSETGTVGIDARVDVGHLLVLVPDGVRVVLDARAGLGDLNVFGVESNGRKVSRHVELGPEGPPQLRLDLSVRTGQVEVRHG